MACTVHLTQVETGTLSLEIKATDREAIQAKERQLHINLKSGKKLLAADSGGTIFFDL